MVAIGILISGSGSNMQAIIDAVAAGTIAGKLVLVISNDPDAYGLTRAASHGIPTVVLRHTDYPSRQAYDRALVAALQAAGVDLVCLAGFMRVITPVLIDAFPGRILNIHPALLPAFPGTHGQRQTFDYGTRFAGCTVHFVDAQVDHGPIVIQAVVPVLPDDDEDSLAARILRCEHRIYPEAVRLFCAGRLRIDGRRVMIADQQTAGLNEQYLINPPLS
ncbi:MAG: phosphoribosylglycinamide formyltransferase [Deltaproteobacteria bacterium]|nr:phosphoribosylglycinamide formyltransferase [Candidatus Anaeroferrophillus wilburensis]MBN2890146.1 phosphoribosylglycinamide formyltransferase [Deltaproteobacteria bacterium]